MSSKTSLAEKKTIKTKKSSSSILAQKLEDSENNNPEVVVPAESDNARKTRKKVK
jgi:hypothetical protein